MISKLEFAKIKRGDVVLFNGTPRVVQEGPSDRQETLSRLASDDPESALNEWGFRMRITFSIRKRSWTGRAKTTYLYNDLKRVIQIAPKLRLLEICKAEKDHLASIGFDWIKELRREVNESLRILDGRKPGRALKLAIRQLKRAEASQ